jgi:multidrug efflux system membrane fusion protein
MNAMIPIAIAATLSLAGCGGGASTKADAEAQPLAVSTVTLAPVEWPSVYEAAGTVRARTSAAISTRVIGYVREVRVRVGDRVAAGQTLVVIDARDLEAGYQQAAAALEEARSAVPEAENGVAAAKASLDLAQVTYGRMEGLFKKASISNQEFDEASARRKLAQANYEMAMARRTQLGAKIAQAEQGLRSAEVMRSYARIDAPFAGVVTDKPVEPGAMAAPGAPLLTIERDGGYRLEVPIEESKLGAVKTGMAVAITLDAVSGAVTGRVSEIVPAVDSASRAFTAKIDLPASQQLRSGLFGRARFPMGVRQTLAVPAAAVHERGQLLSVFVADGGVARARLVTLGEKSGDQVEALSGLSAGDRVVCPVPPALADGARVEVRP